MKNRITIIGFMLLYCCAVLFIGCSGKKTTSVKGIDVNPFADVDTTGDGAFGEAGLNEELKKKVAEALKPVYFEYNSYRLTDEAIIQLSKAVRFLKEQKKMRIIIQGHCDERGSSEYNIGLGEQRAMVIRQYLAAYGITGIRMETMSFGREMPAQKGCYNETCHSLNRRSEFRVLVK